MKEEVLVSRRDAIAVVTLNRPEKRNALSSTMMARLLEVLQAIGADPDVRVMVLRGNGKAFCTGLDLAEMAEARARTGAVALTDLEDVFGVVEHLPQPTIAMVQGDAIAGGCELALHCDLRVAATDVRFSMPLAKLGLAIPLPLVQKLLDAIGTAHTRELLFTGEKLDGERALALRMVNRLVPPDELERAAMSLAETIAANAPLSLRYFKRAIERGNRFRQIEHEDLDRAIAEITASEDVVEGVAAMREKRRPAFKGR
jgi:enoyl-CoA hydratase/carnithine racemase